MAWPHNFNRAMVFFCHSDDGGQDRTYLGRSSAQEPGFRANGVATRPVARRYPGSASGDESHHDRQPGLRDFQKLNLFVKSALMFL